MLFIGTVTRAQAYLVGGLALLAGPSGGPSERVSSSDIVAEDPPGPDEVYIEGITAGGPGCPDPGTVEYAISADKKSFVVIFDEMQLANPPGPSAKHTSCATGIQLHVPGGWQVTLATVNTRGYAFLDEGIVARQTSKYFFAGLPIGTSYHTELQGPYEGEYDFTDMVMAESTVWSPCGTSAIFGITTILSLNAKANPDGEAIFNTDTVDGKFEKVLHWQWRKC